MEVFTLTPFFRTSVGWVRQPTGENMISTTTKQVPEREEPYCTTIRCDAQKEHTHQRVFVIDIEHRCDRKLIQTSIRPSQLRTRSELSPFNGNPIHIDKCASSSLCAQSWWPIMTMKWCLNDNEKLIHDTQTWLYSFTFFIVPRVDSPIYTKHIRHPKYVLAHHPFCLNTSTHTHTSSPKW